MPGSIGAFTTPSGIPIRIHDAGRAGTQLVEPGGHQCRPVGPDPGVDVPRQCGPSPAGAGFSAIVAYAITTFVVWLLYDFTQQYMTPAMLTVGVIAFVHRRPRRDPGAARRGARVGRGAVAEAAGDVRRCRRAPDASPAEGLGACSRIQRTAGHADQTLDALAASITRISRSWSSTTTPGTRPSGSRSQAHCETLGASVPLLPCRSAVGLQGRSAELRVARRPIRPPRWSR